VSTHVILIASGACTDSVTATKLYPPKTNGDLKILHKAIVESSGADLHKISILYYILLDFDAPTGGRNHSLAFEQKAFLPQKYQIYMKGLWYMDQLQFEVSLPCIFYVGDELTMSRMRSSI
jgi:hypothetical protein